MPDLMQQPRSFWERKEGTTGMVVLAAALVGGGLLLYRILPFIITLLQNTLTAVALGGVLFVIAYLVTNKRFRTLVSYGFQSLMRAITGMFVQIDPIGIMKTYLGELKEKIQKIGTELGNLRGQEIKLQRTIEANGEKIDNCRRLAKVAEDTGKRGEMAVQAREAERLTETNAKFKTMLERMKLAEQFLLRMNEASQFVYRDLQNQVDTLAMQRETTNAAYRAFRSAMAIIRGEGEGKELYDQSVEFLADDYARKVGEIDTAMDLSKDFLDSMDLQNAAWEEKGLELLQKWDEETLPKILGAPEQGKPPAEGAAVLDKVVSATDPGKVDTVQQTQPASRYFDN